jgi:riboflavin biosynthesis pyrimidine reductase
MTRQIAGAAVANTRERVGVDGRSARGRVSELNPLESLYESPAIAPSDLTASLARLYGGGLGFAGPTVYTNFVASLDGTVALPGVPRSNALISGDSDADRFVMGLLRACADVVVVGSGTLHGSPTGTWSPAGAHPASASLFAELRLLRGQVDRPELAILSGSGAIDVRHPALAGRAVVLTSTTGEARLRGILPKAADLIPLPSGATIDPRVVLGVLEERGHRLILFEAGPHTFGTFAAAGLVDELFLTVSPLLTGGSAATRLSLVENLEPGRNGLVRGELRSLRRFEDHLFLRYGLRSDPLPTSGV